jgi:hypothetical protein
LVIIPPTGPVNDRGGGRKKSRFFLHFIEAGADAAAPGVQIRFIAMLKPPFKFPPDIRRAWPGGWA